VALFVFAAWTAVGCVDDVVDFGDAVATDAGDDADAGLDTTPSMVDPPPPGDLDGFIGYQMAAGGIPGVATSIVTRDGIAWSGYYGFADIEMARAVDETTLFIVASISKTLTTLALMQLVDEDLVDLDAPADDYLPYAFRNPEFPTEDVTTRMLVSHTTSLRDDFLILSGVTYTTDPEIGLGEFSEAYVTPDALYYGDSNWSGRPGGSYEYCNVNYAIVGHLIEAIRGEDFRAVTEARIFEPLGMTSTGWFLSDVAAEDLATLYTYGRDNEPVPHSGFAYYPASSLRTNIPDLSRFLQATLRDGELEGTRVLSEDVSQSMRLPQRIDLSPRQTITWRFRDIAGEEWLAHTGATYGASAIIAYRPEDGVGLIVMTNSDAYVRGRLGIRGSQDALEAIIDRVAGESAVFR
jgi:CubicO group peptidase (beta-lactamase class C family)